MQLLKVDTLEQAREKLLQAVGDDWLTVCEVPLREARERVLAEDLYGIRDIPEFRRSMVDGYALQAKDTMGAGESIPVFLEVIEDVMIGTETTSVIRPGTGVFCSGLRRLFMPEIKKAPWFSQAVPQDFLGGTIRRASGC